MKTFVRFLIILKTIQYTGTDTENNVNECPVDL